MKPSWESAPDWAEYAAQEITASWYWHEKKPRFHPINQEWLSDGRREIIPKIHRHAKDSLEVRP